MRLRTEFVEQRSVKAERHHGGDAIGLELLQLSQDGITIVILGCSLEANEDAHMGVVRDEARNDGFASIVHDLRSTGNWSSGGRTDGDNAAVADDDYGVVNCIAFASIYHAGTAKGSSLGIRIGGCRNDERQRYPDQRTKQANATHS